MVRAAYEERIVISTTQIAGLDKWEKKETAKLAVEDAGGGGKVRFFCYYKSDYLD